MATMTDRVQRIILGERAANAHVSIGAATRLWNRDGIHWPVSGDESKRANGYLPRRRADSLWHDVYRHGVLSDPLLSE